ncbi:hypothetical protein [Streptomyces vinaceus]|uniref:hypothetical protein n=1 Tax=Streptomyces vinaceus TaxID=1960 RepID=UPI00142EFBD2|nr:hypothetical protein [Streptomyces vinaceus]
MAVHVSLGSVGVSNAEGCEWPGAAGEFYCDLASSPTAVHTPRPQRVTDAPPY